MTINPPHILHPGLLSRKETMLYLQFDFVQHKPPRAYLWQPEEVVRFHHGPKRRVLLRQDRYLRGVSESAVNIWAPGIPNFE